MDIAKFIASVDSATAEPPTEAALASFETMLGRRHARRSDKAGRPSFIMA
jgi:hypothetical protein